MKIHPLYYYVLLFLFLITLTQCKKEKTEDVYYLAIISYNVTYRQFDFSIINISTSEIEKISNLDSITIAWRNSGYYKKDNSIMLKTNLGIIFLDLKNGQIKRIISPEIEQVHFTSTNKLAKIDEIEFDNKTEKIYGVYWNWDENQLYFMSLNIFDETFDVIKSLEGINSYSTGNSAFNSEDGQYIFLTNLGVTVIDINTGEIIYAFNKEIRNLEYISSKNEIIGLSDEGVVSLNYSDKLNHIKTLEDTIGFTSGISTFDLKNDNYIVSSSIIIDEYQLDGEICIETEHYISTINATTGKMKHIINLDENRLTLIEYLY